MVNITPEELDLFSRYIYEISGIQIDANKGYLLESRFQPLLAPNNCKNYAELYHKAKADPTHDLKNQIIDAITTNETYFFRDNRPFELMRNKIIPELIDLRRQAGGSDRIPIKIWSAACSTGQEIYSIAITLVEMLKRLNAYHVSILGTDISDSAIARASYGEYNRFEVERGLSPQFRQKYFTQTEKGWRIRDEIRTMVRLEKRDLTKPFTDLGKFDLIFCRNVAIYFPQAGKIQLFRKLSHALSPGGALIVGASESLSGIADDFAPRYYLNGLYYQLKRDFIPDTASAQRTKPQLVIAPETKHKPAPQTPRSTDIGGRSFADRAGPPSPATAVARPRPVAAPNVNRPAVPSPSPVSAAPPAVSAATPVTRNRIPASGKRPLLASLRKTSGRPSLLASINHRQQIRKKPLLQSVQENADPSKTD